MLITFDQPLIMERKLLHISIRLLMSEAGFNLRSWTSNSSHLRELAQAENVLGKDNKTKIHGLRLDTITEKLSFSEVQLN